MVRILAVSSLLLVLCGCASTSVFNPYPSQAADYKAAITNGTIDDVAPELARKEKSKDGLLYAEESGRLHQLNGQFEASKADFEYVYRQYRKHDDEARITASGVGAGGAALLSNDNAIPYNGYGYERIMALHFQALNYLALGDREGALVELRRATLEQRTLELAHQKAVSRAEQKAREEQIATSSWQSAPELQGLNRLAGQVKSSFQNAYTFYTSAVVHEAAGDINAALVDYKKALEINPDNATIAADVKRLDAGRTVGGSDQGHLVVVFEDGFVAERQAFQLSLPYFAGQQYATYFTVAFPFYVSHNYPGHQLTVYQGNHSLGHTEMVANINAMAARALKEQIPMMIVRMVLRARAKHELHQKSSEEGGLLGSFLATVYNVVSEQADLRSWLTLPANAQILREPMPPGEHRLELNMQGVSQNIDITIRRGKITLLRVINANNRLLVQPFEI